MNLDPIISITFFPSNFNGNNNYERGRERERERGLNQDAIEL